MGGRFIGKGKRAAAEAENEQVMPRETTTVGTLNSQTILTADHIQALQTAKLHTLQAHSTAGQTLLANPTHTMIQIQNNIPVMTSTIQQHASVSSSAVGNSTVTVSPLPTNHIQTLSHVTSKV